MRFGIDKEYGLAMIAIMCYVYDVTLWWPVNCIAPKSRHETCHWKMLLMHVQYEISNDNNINRPKPIPMRN